LLEFAHMPTKGIFLSCYTVCVGHIQPNMLSILQLFPC